MRGELGHERVTVGCGRPRRRGGPGHGAALRGAGGPAGPCSTRSSPLRLPDRLTGEVPREVRMAADYFLRHAPGRRRPGGRAGHPGAAAPVRIAAVLRLALLGRAGDLHLARTWDFMTESFVRRRLRFRALDRPTTSTWGGPRPTRPSGGVSWQPNPTPTLILYGPEDHVIPRDFPERMEAAFPERVGPFHRASAPGTSSSGRRRTC